MSLVSALAAAGATFVGEANALELARNLATVINYGFDGAIEDLVDEALESRRVVRVGGWILTDDVNSDRLARALVDAAETVAREVCGCWPGESCSDCEAA